jgi:hypothetical protein
VARRLAIALLSAAAIGSPLLAASLASADADPASDILLGSPVFYPFQPPVSGSLQHQLEHALAQLGKNGLNLKVAIIGSAVDLGAVTNLFAKPQTYADFLDREISFNGPQPLLVVMPNGFGTSHAGPLSALSGLAPDAAHQSDGLARSALLAVVRIAKANGKPISASASGGGGGGSTSPLIIFGVPAVLVVLAAWVAALLRRRATDRRRPCARSR